VPPRSVAFAAVAVVALSLVAAPVTMADWSEQAAFSAERVEPSEFNDATPVLQYDELAPGARDAVRRTIESPDGYHTVYGREDWPDRFHYSDYAAPGRGTYAIVYGSEYYRLDTYAGGGFPFVYWILELPFVVYGLLLGTVGYQVRRGGRSARTATILAAAGVAFHLLGPEFDFPLLEPMAFVGLGALAVVAVGVGLLWDVVRPSPDADPG